MAQRKDFRDDGERQAVVHWIPCNLGCDVQDRKSGHWSGPHSNCNLSPTADWLGRFHAETAITHTHTQSHSGAASHRITLMSLREHSS